MQKSDYRQPLIDILERTYRCFLCLKPWYTIKTCSSKYVCRKYNEEHHNSICDKEEYKNSHVPQNDSPNSTVAFVDQSKSIFPANTSALIFGWKWRLSRRTFIDVVSTLTKQHWNNYDRITSTQRRWPNVVSTLTVSWKWNFSHCMYISDASTSRKQHLNNFINSCTNVH